jgi:hypothetical protein
MATTGGLVEDMIVQQGTGSGTRRAYRVGGVHAAPGAWAQPPMLGDGAHARWRQADIERRVASTHIVVAEGGHGQRTLGAQSPQQAEDDRLGAALHPAQ